MEGADMPFVKVNPKEDKKKLIEEYLELESEFEVVDKEFSLFKVAIEYRKRQKTTQSSANVILSQAKDLDPQGVLMSNCSEILLR